MTRVIDSFQGKYRWLSNFWMCPGGIQYGDYIYPSTEHAYQAAKTIVDSERLEILRAKTPGQAKRLGRRVTMRPDWDLIKIDVMRTVLKQKFNDEELAQKLRDTGNAELIEGNHWGDTFWGVCKGAGHNHLGKLLMEIRSTYINQLDFGLKTPEQTIEELEELVSDYAAKIQYLLDHFSHDADWHDGVFTFPDGDTWELGVSK